jgi:ATP-dependent Clp endopeptidase proteolytic subunit ClpP
MATSLRSSQAPKRIFAAAKKNDELELLVYDSIGESWFGGGVTAEAVKQKLNEAGDVSKITLRINSPGGDVFEASAIYSVLTQHKAKVECYVDGLAASAAFTIAMAGEKIHISESAMMMCHNSLGACMGYASDMRQMADLLDKVSGTMRDIYANKSGMKADEVQALMDAETWMTAAEAVAYGFADDVVKREPDADEEAQALAAAYDLSKFKANPRAAKDTKRVAGKDEADDPDEGDCQCDCPECKAGNCAECSDPNCKDPNCEDNDEDDPAKAAAEVERLREEFAFLTI